MYREKKKSVFKKMFIVFVITVSAVVTNASDSFKFAVVGDRTGRERIGYFEKTVVESLNLLLPEFVVNTGDNINGYTEDVNIINQQWDSFEASIKKLQVPFYRTVGNHDISNDVMLSIYKNRYGQTYHHYLCKDVLFLFVNTEDPPIHLASDVKAKLNAEINGIRKRIKKEGYTAKILADLEKYEDKSTNIMGAQISDEQIEYFKDVLEKNTDVRWTFVVMHKRVWKQHEPPANWFKLEKLLANRKYTVFAGHEHMHEYAVRNGNDYIGLGTAGGGWLFPNTVAGVYDHVLIVTVGDGQPVICNILMDSIFSKTDIKAGVAK